MENEKKEVAGKVPAGENKNSCSCKNDLRTFLIALLTSIIVVALYHFGTGVYAIFNDFQNYNTIPVVRQYMLVPVAAMPCREFGPDAGMDRRHHQDFRKRHGFRKGGMQGECPQMKCGMKNRPCMQGECPKMGPGMQNRPCMQGECPKMGPGMQNRPCPQGPVDDPQQKSGKPMPPPVPGNGEPVPPPAN